MKANDDEPQKAVATAIEIGRDFTMVSTVVYCILVLLFGKIVLDVG